MVRLPLRRALVAGCLLSPLTAQGNWTQLTPATKPAARGNTQFATDQIALYVFGGSSSSTVFLNDLWIYRVNNWVELTKDGATGSPARRRWGSACWDYGRSELVIFGGQDVNKNNLGDTWVYSGSKWVQKTPATSPSARRWGVMAYDWANSRVLLFGGYGTANMNDTWAWTGSSWLKLNPKTSPPIKSRAGFVSIKKDKEILMYGGTTTTTTATPTTEMWKWDGSDWTAVKQSGGPTSGVEPGMVYDEYRDVVLFYGGHNVAPQSLTFEWDGKAWAQRKVTSPGPRSRPSIGYLAGLQKTIMFGGYTGALPFKDDTWEYKTDKPASFATSGTGCQSSAGTPAMSATSLPWTGAVLSLQVNPVPATAPALISLGFSKTQWSAFKLPLDLTLAGAPGCHLYTGLDAVFPAALNQNTATLGLPIPADTAFAGVQLFHQALIVEKQNSLGLVFSNLGESTIGVR